MTDEFSRRKIRQQRDRIISEFEWLVNRNDEEGFRRYLEAHEIEPGTKDYELAWEAWREKLAEKQRPRLRR